MLAVGCGLEPRHGPYLGEEAPGATPTLFAPGIVSSGVREDTPPVFAPGGGEVYVHLAERPFNFASRIDRSEDRWGAPRVLPFADHFRHGRMAIAPDGSRLYFSSTRPLDGSGPEKDHDIWYVERTEEGWGVARNLGAPINTEHDEIDFSIGGDGTLYFDREIDGVPGDLMAAEWSGDRFEEPRSLGMVVNSAHLEAAPAIAKDGSYVVFTSGGRADQIGPLDLYVSFRLADGRWSAPRNLGPPVNTRYCEKFPVLSPDGLYLFFVSRRPVGDEELPPCKHEPGRVPRGRDDVTGAADVYWVSTEVIERLRPRDT